MFDVTCDALYPSRKVRSQSGAREFVSDVEVPVFNRIGVYALRPVALRAYLSWPKGVSERLNGLDRLVFWKMARDCSVHEGMPAGVRSGN